MINKIGLYFNTLRYLSVEQIIYQIIYRFKTKYFIKKTILTNSFIGTNVLKLTESVENKENKYNDLYFVFLNEKRSIDLLKLDWDSKEKSKLWRYNLHYFDWLKDHNVSSSIEQQKKIINSWIDSCQPGKEDAWEPYPVSLRIVNWIKYFVRLERLGSDIPNYWLISLYSQCLWLNKNVEYHLKANHIFKNSVALIFAGCYFQGEKSRKWLTRGIKIFNKEIAEQFNSDGGHFERSPMYHALCLEDVLDIYNVLINIEDPIRDKAMGAIREFLPNGFSYLKSLTFPDGNISYIGDSVKGVAASYEDLRNYYFRIFSFYPEEHNENIKNEQDLNTKLYINTGIFICESRQQKVILNLGKPSPDYQPGHSHCDLFSYELFAKKINCRVIVDSGVSEYQRGRFRQYCRSTRAHNTVTVNHLDQNEIWGEFRVARRVKKVEQKYSVNPERTITTISMNHDGYRRIGRHVRHYRCVKICDQAMNIIDKVTGQGVTDIISYIHLHPDINIKNISSNQILLQKENINLGEIKVESGQITTEIGWYFPEFGVKKKNMVLAIKQNHRELFETRYTVRMYSN